MVVMKHKVFWDSRPRKGDGTEKAAHKETRTDDFSAPVEYPSLRASEKLDSDGMPQRESAVA